MLFVHLFADATFCFLNSAAHYLERSGQQQRSCTLKFTSSTTPQLLDIIHELVTAAGVREKFEADPEFHLKLKQEAYMPLVIEARPAGNSFLGEKRHVSIAHYYEQNGDFVADPIILMTDMGYPIYMEQVLGGLIQVLSKDPKLGVLVNTRAKRSVEELMDVWAENIRQQDWLEVAREYMERRASDTKGAAL